VKPAAVLFDAGNTLLFLDHARLAREVGADIGLPLTAERLAAQAGPAALALERGEVSDRERATAYLETLFLLAGVPRERLAAVRASLLRLHKERHLWSGTHAGTPEALRSLLESGIRLGVVSNSDGRAEEALQAAGILEYFEVVIDSQLVGFEKPDPRIFHSALELLELPADLALYVGDIYEVDVVGARRAGMDVVLLDPQGTREYEDVRSVRSVAELARLVLNVVPDPSHGIARI
jgi:HAD superfamily hydrolase (TIGR01509 family)